jgi:hypothetical protein
MRAPQRWLILRPAASAATAAVLVVCLPHNHCLGVSALLGTLVPRASSPCSPHASWLQTPQRCIAASPSLAPASASDSATTSTVPAATETFVRFTGILWLCTALSATSQWQRGQRHQQQQWGQQREQQQREQRQQEQPQQQQRKQQQEEKMAQRW